jgi:hypothetical protein
VTITRWFIGRPNDLSEQVNDGRACLSCLNEPAAPPTSVPVPIDVDLQVLRSL